MACALKISFKGATYKENSRGPKTNPCGTLYLTVEVVELKLFTLTNWVRSSRYEASHFQAFPEIPKRCSSLVNKIECSIVSASTRSIKCKMLVIK